MPPYKDGLPAKIPHIHHSPPTTTINQPVPYGNTSTTSSLIK